MSFSIKIVTKCSDISHDEAKTVSSTSFYGKKILSVRCVKVSFSIKIVTKCTDISHNEVITVSSTFLLKKKILSPHFSPSC